jgi:hypothetical protein
MNGLITLIGHTLSCAYLSGSGYGDVTTDYTFLKGAQGQPQVVVSSSIDGNRVMGYSLDGSTLTIDDPDDSSIVYDLSSDKIVRKFKSCVLPGEGGGDSKPVCENAVETCTLK